MWCSRCAVRAAPPSRRRSSTPAAASITAPAAALPPPPNEASLVPPELQLYDSPEAAAAFDADGEACEATLSVEGIRCAACVWLIERRLLQVAGVQSAHLNVATERLQVRWDQSRLQAERHPGSAARNRLRRLSVRSGAAWRAIAARRPHAGAAVVHRRPVDDAGDDVCGAGVPGQRRHHGGRHGKPDALGQPAADAAGRAVFGAAVFPLAPGATCATARWAWTCRWRSAFPPPSPPAWWPPGAAAAKCISIR